MRTKDRLFQLDEVAIFCQYLYMSEDHKILFNNGLCELEIKMGDNFRFYAKNLNFPHLPDMDYTETLTIPNILGVIGRLKELPPEMYKSSFSNRWQEIKDIAITNMALNKLK